MNISTVITFHNGFNVEERVFPRRLTMVEGDTCYTFSDISDINGKELSICKSRFIYMSHEEPASSGCTKE